MSIREIHEKMAQGWTFAEAKMGKGWETKYPNLTSWQGGYCLFGTGGNWKITLETHSHSTNYTLAVKESAEPDEYRAVDDAIKSWNDEHGTEAILRIEKGGLGEADWEVRYPHIAKWIERGKRHCIDIKVNLVSGKLYAKAWLYDKPSNTEAVLFERKVENMTENEVLQMLDAAIGNWLDANEIAKP